MPADLKKSEDSDPTPPITMANWHSKWKNQPSQVEELAKKAAKKNVSESKPTDQAPKKTCICSPTSHAGSFRCNLHRTTEDQKLSWSLEDSSDRKSSVKMDPKNGNFPNAKQQLSRFGRAAFADNNLSGKSK